MKKNLILICAVCIAFMYGCQDDEASFGDITTPSNLDVVVTVASDLSGNVTVVPTADNVNNFQVLFQEDADPVIVSESGGTASFRYTQPGQYSEIITVIAYGTGGASSSQSITIDLDVRLDIDPVLLEALVGASTGASTKKWIWDAGNAGHFGVGDPEESFPNFFSAAPNQINACMYDDVLTFSHDGTGTFTYNVETQGASFMNWAEVKRFFPEANPIQFEDECRDLSTQIATDRDTNFVIVTDADTNASTIDVVNSTLSYWSGAMAYDIIELTENKLVVRGIQEPFDPTGAPLAWYHTFVPAQGVTDDFCDDGGATGATGSGNNDVLVWADEFDVDGPPCDANWQYDLGTGSGGWGNGEQQYYTDRPENVIVEGGVLKITAKAETFEGSSYTSARLKSENKYEFQYGRIEFRAKLPKGGGTWPALWTLGADYQTNTWPAAGEMDVMEHVGNQQNKIFSTVHFPGNSGGNAIGDEIDIPNVSEEFHIYELLWTAEDLRFSVDGELHFTFENDASLPFNKDFFF